MTNSISLIAPGLVKSSISNQGSCGSLCFGRKWPLLCKSSNYMSGVAGGGPSLFSWGLFQLRSSVSFPIVIIRVFALFCQFYERFINSDYLQRASSVSFIFSIVFLIFSMTDFCFIFIIPFFLVTLFSLLFQILEVGAQIIDLRLFLLTRCRGAGGSRRILHVVSPGVVGGRASLPVRGSASLFRSAPYGLRSFFAAVWISRCPVFEFDLSSALSMLSVTSQKSS